MEEISQDQQKIIQEAKDDDSAQDMVLDAVLYSFKSFKQPTSPRNEEPLLSYKQQNVSIIPSNSTSLSASDGSELEGKVCRICHNGGNEEKLLSPCRCCGSAKYAHQSCLMTWFEKKKNKICEICLYEVKLVRKGFKFPTRWKLPGTSCNFVTFLFMFYCLVLTAFISMVLWVASNGCTTTVCVVLYFVSILSLIYFTYCCGFMKQIVHYLTDCLDMNREVTILNRAEDCKPIRSSIIETGITS
ncbi:E3 ubiquitin-protein ligase MARCH8-like [Actinia tenebrosa]|uniref:E3 ubiquitin-protein ligase MARCH8-like n=1 Tax=Actinia tenebrosa TaxID=6105 RepID=A0A6P8IZN6_ACTTE|nr:E3 ubiquitin-protein ligase MARCH8-like [Actinia tenebrosa]